MPVRGACGAGRPAAAARTWSAREIETRSVGVRTSIYVLNLSVRLPTAILPVQIHVFYTPSLIRSCEKRATLFPAVNAHTSA